MYDDNFGEQIRGWISNSSNGRQTSADNERQLKTWLHENHCDLRCFLWYSPNGKLRGLWDAMCAIYRCLILSSLYQPGSNNVMRNIILLKFTFCLWCLMSDRQCHRFQPESDLQSKLLSGCFPGIVLDLWTLVSECCFFSCCVFVLDFGKDDKCGKSDGSSSTLLIVCKCSNLLQR